MRVYLKLHVALIFVNQMQDSLQIFGTKMQIEKSNGLGKNIWDVMLWLCNGGVLKQCWQDSAGLFSTHTHTSSHTQQQGN